MGCGEPLRRRPTVREDSGARGFQSRSSWRYVGWCQGRPDDGRPRRGAARQVLGAAQDVSRGVKGGEAPEEDERLREAFEGSAIGQALVAPDSTFLMVNRALCEISGYSEEELLELYLRSITYPLDRQAGRDAWQLLLSGEVSNLRLEKRYVHAERNRVVWALVNLSTVVGKDGKPAYFVAQSQDITERKRAERERTELERRLQQAQRMESVGQLAGGIAHDFNNLLAVILNYSSFIRGEIGDDDPIRDDVEEIQRAAERAAALTHQLLVFSRRELVEPETIDLNAVVADMHKLLLRTLGEDVKLGTALAPGLAPVEADRGQIEQVIVNLAVNARDAMPQGGTLMIETANVEPATGGGRRVSLRVTDTGCGMEDMVAARAFEPFFSTKPRGKGSGLGLATVYGIVAQAAGEIELDSAPGRGTAVELRLPAAEASGAPVPAPRRRAVAAGQGHETILVVEDEHAVRELTARILSRRGHEVLSAGSPTEALHVFANHEWPIDLLLTDVVMPDMSGKELAERIRHRQPRLRVLYMSGYDDEIVSRHGVVEAGASFLQKPFDAQGLVARVDEVLRCELS